MRLSAPFKAKMKARVERDPAFSAALLTEGVNALFEGDFETGKAVRRDYIDGSIGFEALAAAIGKSPNVLRRMFSGAGKPSASNLFAVIRELQAKSGVTLRVSAA